MTDDPALADRLAEWADGGRIDSRGELAQDLREAVQALREADEKVEHAHNDGWYAAIVKVATLLADADLPCQNPRPVLVGMSDGTGQRRLKPCGECANCKLNELRGTDE